MRGFIVGASALALLACGEKPQTGEEVALAPAETTAPAGPAAPPPPCTTEGLPLTGVCTDANPALFVAVNSQAQLFSRTCIWKTKEVKLSEQEAILFRAQDCGGDPIDAHVFSAEGRSVKYRLASMAENDTMPIVQIFDLGTGQTAEQAASQTLAEAPGDQRGRCGPKPLTGLPAAGRVFELAPNDDLTREMEAKSPDEPWDACGPHGVTMEAVQYWEGRDRHALFHMIGQDDPSWDPASFTFYVRNPDGSWSKRD